ncbi:hypothetical protein V2J09_014273 [Rumex salicifolius]
MGDFHFATSSSVSIGHSDCAFESLLLVFNCAFLSRRIIPSFGSSDLLIRTYTSTSWAQSLYEQLIEHRPSEIPVDYDPDLGMGLTQSKEQLLFLQINHKNIEGIKSLYRSGASLELGDKEGRTPLIYSCMNADLCTVAKTLIELGANVNAYRPGRYCGTPLHHAAKRGLAPTVELLLSHGANALLVNDDCQTPLEVARAKGFDKVVRMIESHICLFSGWLRELYGPSILERLVPQILSRKVWAVVVPCGSRDLQKPYKLELAIYSGMQDAKPRMTFPLWKAGMANPSFGQYEYTVVVSEPSSMTIPPPINTAFPYNAPATFAPMAAPSSSEDAELTMAINASLQSAIQEGMPVENASSSSVSAEFHPPISAPFEPSAPPIDSERSSACVVCLDATVEGACVPCGHMAGCISCLNEVKAKNWGCPICRAKIDQIIREPEYILGEYWFDVKKVTIFQLPKRHPQRSFKGQKFALN